MAESQKGKSRKVGRNSEKCKRYRARSGREHNKLKRILQSSGADEARRWARANQCERFLKGA